MAQTLSTPNKMIINDFTHFLKENGYTNNHNRKPLSDQIKTEEIPVEYWQTEIQPNPNFQLYQHPRKRTLIVEIVGNLWSFMTELSIKYLKELGVQPKVIQVYSEKSNNKIFEIESIPNPLFVIQQHFNDDIENSLDFKLIIQMGAVSTKIINKKHQIKPGKLASPLRKIPLPMRIKSTVAPSQIMFKRRKLSQLARREIEEPETPIPPPIQPKEEDPIVVYHLPILDTLSKPQQVILKEILRRPKKKVQSNHIAKKTNLEQDLIRTVLRELVDKNVLRVSSGWYILKKPPDAKDESETMPPKTKLKKTARKKRRRH